MAELRRVADELAEAEALVDAAARQEGGLLYLRAELGSVRRLLARIGAIVDDAHRAERGADLVLARTNAWLLALPFAIVVAVFLTGPSWWMSLLVWISAYAAFVACGYLVTGTVVRDRAHRRALRRTSLTGLVPVDVDGDVSPDELTSPLTAHRDAQTLLRSRFQRDGRASQAGQAGSWRAKVRLGQAAAALVGVPGAAATPHFQPSAVLPAVRRLVVDIDGLTSHLAWRPFGWRGARHGMEHYRRARAALVHVHEQLADTATKMLDEGKRIGAADQRNSSRASHSMARSSSRTW